MTREEQLELMLDSIFSLKKEREELIKEHDIKIKALSLKLEVLMDTSEIGSVKVDGGTAVWRNGTSVEVKDWNAVMEYVMKNQAFDCIQKRIAPAQLEKRIKAGAKIKGVTIKKTKTFVITGAKEKHEEASEG